jgi:hypothetical protein
MSTTNNNNKSTSLKNMKTGESVVGYIKGFIKAPKSSQPEQEHPVLVTKTGEELVFWASGDVSYIKERMQEKGVGIGVLCKITRDEMPNGYKGRKKYFATIAFKKDDVRTDLGSVSSSGGATDSDGFEY